MNISSRHLVDPELSSLLDAFPTVAITHENLPAVREAARQPIPLGVVLPADAVALSTHRIDGPVGAPQMSVHAYRSERASRTSGCIFHMHGGGFVGGEAAARARAEDFAALPPTFISTAALDLFLEEDLEYARRLMRAGVPVEVHVYPGPFHAFDLHPTAPVACAARRDSLGALRRFVGL